MTPRRNNEAGFTLVETLVALAILAMSAVSLLGATEAHIARISALETRAAAQWITENYLAEMTVGRAASDAEIVMMGISFSIEVTRTPTQDPDLEQADVIARANDDGRDYGRLTGFLDTASNQRNEN